MNTKIVVPSACVAGISIATIAFIQKNRGDSTVVAMYEAEIDRFNKIPKTELGAREASFIKIAKLRDSLNPERAEKRTRNMYLAATAKTLEEKIGFYRKAVNDDPEDTSAMELLADHLSMHGDIEESRKIYLKIIEVSKIDVQVENMKKALNYLDKKRKLK